MADVWVADGFVPSTITVYNGTDGSPLEPPRPDGYAVVARILYRDETWKNVYRWTPPK